MKQLIDKFLNIQFLTFCIIGGVNTLLAQVIYIVLVKGDLFNPGVCSVIGDVVTIAVSYVLNMKFTYHEKMSLKSAMSFPVSYLPGTIINSIVVMVVVDLLHFPKLFAKAISLPITIPLNYIFVSLVVKLTKKEKK